MALERRRSQRRQVREKPINKCRIYCRRLSAFLFSHLGLTSLVICYTIVGAIAFNRLEINNEEELVLKMNKESQNVVLRLWGVTVAFNILHKQNWTKSVEDEIRIYQGKLVEAVKGGYDAQENGRNQWSLPGAFLYCLTVITTIGYGNIAPKTTYGKIVTILYAIVGIPLMFLYLTNIGNGLAKGFKYVYVKLCGKNKRLIEYRETDQPKGRKSGNIITVPVHWCFFVIGIYICGGGALFSAWEKWSFLDGVYFCFITLSTIGFGDLVPGDSVVTDSGSQGKLVICSIYVLGGMALIAMCFNLVQEEVVHKIKNLGKRLGIISNENE
ncbi:potassium channel subfamily K member 18-like isoform X1 [Centruroides sculpturatus]|uniref:potassium channel subfamily K member 18-like isoform X1 n=2 Tax=Centruroides sculpturatus TaxID=218467 RepID=UPI000C6D8859|nr:potassium channel subfamily K member 18-like isoform X1 [Centruroides sculpturatus]